MQNAEIDLRLANGGSGKLSYGKSHLNATAGLQCERFNSQVIRDVLQELRQGEIKKLIEM